MITSLSLLCMGEISPEFVKVFLISIPSYLNYEAFRILIASALLRSVEMALTQGALLS